MSMKNFVYAGIFNGHKVYLEKGEKLNWTYKIPLLLISIMSPQSIEMTDEEIKEMKTLNSEEVKG